MLKLIWINVKLIRDDRKKGSSGVLLIWTWAKTSGQVNASCRVSHGLERIYCLLTTKTRIGFCCFPL